MSKIFLVFWLIPFPQIRYYITSDFIFGNEKICKTSKIVIQIDYQRKIPVQEGPFYHVLDVSGVPTFCPSKHFQTDMNSNFWWKCCGKQKLSKTKMLIFSKFSQKRWFSEKIAVFEMNIFSELILKHGFYPVCPSVPDLTHFFWVRVKLRPVVKGHERSILYDWIDIIQMMKHSPRSLLKISKNLKILSGLMDNDDLVFRINDIFSGPKMRSGKSWDESCDRAALHDLTWLSLW